MTALLALFEAGRLKPVAGSSLPLERLDEGFEMLRRRKSVGKVVITL
jgi:NADPH2:quinone reductase